MSALAVMDNPEIVGDRIRRRRLELNKTRDQLAEDSGLSRNTVFRYETGQVRRYHDQNLVQLAEALKVTALWLLEGGVLP